MNTALVVVDLQNAFCMPWGSFAQRGGKVENLAEVMSGCRRLVEHADEVGWEIVFTAMTFSPDYHEAGLLVQDRPVIRAESAYQEGSPDAEIVEALQPVPAQAWVQRKTRYDPFAGTDFETRLRERDVSNLVVCGVLTNVCVESTVRRAYDLDFPVQVVTDATSSTDSDLHQASLETLSRHFATCVQVSDLVGAPSSGRGEGA
ncbi:MAG: cysteine hydrolase family protein [Myxococcota bacterium]